MKDRKVIRRIWLMLAKLRGTQWRDWVAPAQVALGIAALAVAITKVPNADSVAAAHAEPAVALCPTPPVGQSVLAGFVTRLSLDPSQQKSWQDLAEALGRVCVPALAAESSLDAKLADAEAVDLAQLNALRRARRAIWELRPRLTPAQRDVIDHLPVGTEQ
jgi:hypothetical protein